jgi:hypothetical protein
MNISQETLKRIEAQLDRLERDKESVGSHRELWLLAGFRPTGIDDSWHHEDGRTVTYMHVLTTYPEGSK